MTKEEILQAFDDINFVYNDCTKYDTLKRMLEELTADVVPMDFHNKVLEIEIKKQENLVEVVRCKDCKYYSHIQMGSNPGVCAVNILAYTATEPENYCGYGERKILPKD